MKSVHDTNQYVWDVFSCWLGELGIHTGVFGMAYKATSDHDQQPDVPSSTDQTPVSNLNATDRWVYSAIKKTSILPCLTRDVLARTPDPCREVESSSSFSSMVSNIRQRLVQKHESWTSEDNKSVMFDLFMESRSDISPEKLVDARGLRVLLASVCVLISHTA